MRAVVQRVSRCHVYVGEEIVGEIRQGLLVLLGVAVGDELADAKLLADKSAGLRIFSDQAGKMNLSVRDINGGVLVISQFTLLGDARNGKRPSFTQAAPPDHANELYEFLCEQLRQTGIAVATGRFRADMQVHLINDGPVTILLDSRKLF